MVNHIAHLPPRPWSKAEARAIAADAVLNGGTTSDETMGEAVIRWIETRCFVPEGKLIGKPFRLPDWQKEVILDVYDNPHGPTRRAILSFGRKNGKTTLAALLLLAHLCGPCHRPNSQLYSAAQSREQASLIFRIAVKIIRMSPDMRAYVRVKESMKELECRELGTRFRALSAEATTAFGLNPSFMVHDELGQVRGPRSTLYEALETATGGQVDPLSIVISTQARTDADLLSILIDDAVAANDPRVVVKLYTAPVDADPFDPATIRLANPGLADGDFMVEDEVVSMAEDARRMPAREAEFRNLVLNQRIEINDPFVAPALWKACGAIPVDLKGREVYGGLDLGEVADLTAFVLIGWVDGRWHVKPTFWLPEEGLERKSVADRVPYDMWRAKGFLETTPGKSVTYEYVAGHLRRVFDTHHVRMIAFDRWNIRHLVPWLNRVGFRDAFIKEKFLEFGQGMASMSPALRDLEQVIRDGKLCHGNHPILSMCASNAIVVRDDAGNRKLSKRRSTGRIDGLVALAMAVASAPVKPRGIDVSSLIV